MHSTVRQLPVWVPTKLPTHRPRVSSSASVLCFISADYWAHELYLLTTERMYYICWLLSVCFISADFWAHVLISADFWAYVLYRCCSHCVSTISPAGAALPEGVQLPHVAAPDDAELPPGEGCYSCDINKNGVPLVKPIDQSQTDKSTGYYRRKRSAAKDDQSESSYIGEAAMAPSNIVNRPAAAERLHAVRKTGRARQLQHSSQLTVSICTKQEISRLCYI